MGSQCSCSDNVNNEISHLQCEQDKCEGDTQRFCGSSTSWRVWKVLNLSLGTVLILTIGQYLYVIFFSIFINFIFEISCTRKKEIQEQITNNS